MIAVTSPGFVLFAVLLAGLWFACPPPRRWQLLLGANLVFYAVLSWRTLPLLLGCTFLVWWCARRAAAKKATFCAGLAAALLPLAALKYLPVVIGWQGTLVSALGIGYYTLQLVGYLCDVRRGKILPEERYARLLCYATFFLSITQGPFNRYGDLMPQLDAPTKWDAARAWRGAQRSAWGYFKKFAIADSAAVVAETVFANPAAFDRTQILLGVLLYTFQLYADFSGYTDIVLGVGEVLGLRLPENFRQPFFADSVKDLWARWHISLSHWLRDYVYIPLGGGRCGKAKKDRNLVLTFLVSGLWHGAGLNYLAWGGIHGVLQSVENHLPPRRDTKLRHVLRVLGTFCIMMATLIVFRSGTLDEAMTVFKGIACNSGHAAFTQYWRLGLTSMQEQVTLYLGIVILLCVDAAHEKGICLREKIAALPTPARWAVYEVCIFAFLFMGRFLGGGSFLYAIY